MDFEDAWSFTLHETCTSTGLTDIVNWNILARIRSAERDERENSLHNLKSHEQDSPRKGGGGGSKYIHRIFKQGLLPFGKVIV